MNSEFMYRCGIVLIVLFILGCGISLVIFLIRGKKLRETLDKEYGANRTSGRGNAK